MTAETKRNIFYWVFKVSSIIVSCLFPARAVWEKFPIWNVTHGTTRSVGVGLIIILIVCAIVFKKTVFDFLSDKLNLKHAPPIAVLLIMLIVCYILIYIGNFLKDLTNVLWMGVIGCAIGTVFTFIGEHYFGNKEKNDGSGA